MSEPSKKPLVILGIILTPPAALGGLFLGAMLFTRWQALKTPASIGLLPHYFAHTHQMSPAMHTAFIASCALAGIITLAPALMILVATFMKPKRELHGSARFANRAEIFQAGLLNKPKIGKPADKRNQKQTDQAEYPALLLGKYKGQLLRWMDNGFVLVAARTRAGKGVSIIVPNCLNYRDSMVVYDPKFENFLLTAGFRAQAGQKVFLFNPGGLMPGISKAAFEERDEHGNIVSDADHVAQLAQQAEKLSQNICSHRWNPFTYISRNPLFTYRDLSNMAAIMYPMDGGGKNGNAFWIESARKLFVGLSLYMIETEAERPTRDADYKQRSSLGYLYRLATQTHSVSHSSNQQESDSNEETSNNLQAWLKSELDYRAQSEAPLSDACHTLLADFANGNAKTNADIISTFTQPLGIFLDPIVEAVTSDDDFRLDDIRRCRMTVYLGIKPTETGTFARLTNLFFSQLINVNVEQGLPENNLNPATGKTTLPHQCLLLMDEFTALGNVPAIMDGVSYVAGYGLRLMIIVQSPAQIEAVYGRENARTFFTNFACRVMFTPRDQTEAKEYSEILGNETVKAKSKSRSTGRGTSHSQSISEQKRALMYDTEIKQMPMDKCILDMAAMPPIYADKIRYYDDPLFKERAKIPPPIIPIVEPTLSKVRYVVPKKEKKAKPLKQHEIQIETANNKDPFAQHLVNELALGMSQNIADFPNVDGNEKLGQFATGIQNLWRLDDMPTCMSVLASGMKNPSQSLEAMIDAIPASSADDDDEWEAQDYSQDDDWQSG